MHNEITLPLVDDFHIHLRQDEAMKKVTPLVRQAGVGRVMVMPNLKPPVMTVNEALDYKKQLQSVDNSVDYLMSIYFNADLTYDELKKAKQNNVNNFKLYPQGVTTNSAQGVSDISQYYETFESMQELGLMLNIHGEVSSDFTKDICVLNAEQNFLTILEDILKKFPKLKVVLEHTTTKEAVEFVKDYQGSNLAATITPQHLAIVVDHWGGCSYNYCKPVAKFPRDRQALRDVVVEGNSKFFLGSDSAPHSKEAKLAECGCAGVFSYPHVLSYYLDVFEEIGAVEKFEGFATKFGHEFYQLPEQKETITLVKEKVLVPNEIEGIVPFRYGQEVGWKAVS